MAFAEIFVELAETRVADYLQVQADTLLVKPHFLST